MQKPEPPRGKRGGSGGRVHQTLQSDSSVRLLESAGWTSTTPSRDAAAREACDLVHVALQRLPEIYREVLRLTELEGRTPTEVAETLGRSVGAAVVVEGMGLGRICHQGVGSRRYCIAAATEGGHSWVDFGSPSAVHALVSVAHGLTQLEVPAEPRTTFNIGVITGGRSVNTIADSASLQLDLRSEAEASLAAADEQAKGIVEAYSADGVSVEMTTIGDRPTGGIPREHPLVELCYTVAGDLGTEPYSKPSSTDANVPLSLGIPAVCIGITKGEHAHRRDEYIETGPVATGLEQLLRIVRGAYTVLT